MAGCGRSKPLPYDPHPLNWSISIIRWFSRPMQRLIPGRLPLWLPANSLPWTSLWHLPPFVNAPRSLPPSGSTGLLSSRCPGLVSTSYKSFAGIPAFLTANPRRTVRALHEIVLHSYSCIGRKIIIIAGKSNFYHKRYSTYFEWDASLQTCWRLLLLKIHTKCQWKIMNSSE